MGPSLVVGFSACMMYLTCLFSFLKFMQVILVGHDFGGACISYMMELFPSKVLKAVFVAAAMWTSGQSTLDMFSQKVSNFIL